MSTGAKTCTQEEKRRENLTMLHMREIGFGLRYVQSFQNSSKNSEKIKIKYLTVIYLIFGFLNGIQFNIKSEKRCARQNWPKKA